MMCSDQRYRTYVAILHEELLPAMGCTEPISIALAAATAREALHELPARIEIYVSNNIIKNVKSVVVPNTGGQKGIAAAVAIGTVAGEAQRMLEVISNVTNQNIVEMQRFLRSADIEVHPAQDGDVFDIRVIAYNAAGGSAACRIQGGHTNITEISKDGKPLLKTAYVQALNSSANRKLLTVEGIVDFAESCCLDDISAPIERQIAYNTLATLMIPTQLIFVPMFLLFSKMKLINSYLSLILPFCASGFGIFMVRQRFMQIPEELIEAARLDNASELKILTHVMIPMARPTITTMLLLTFISRWNDYFWPMVMTTKDSVRTLSVGVAMLRETEAAASWNTLMAGNVILVLPILILFIFAQKQIIQAFAYSGEK